VVEEIVEHSGTPYFCFKDIDENKPSGSIKIRVETIAYFLSRHREDLADSRKKKIDIDRQLAEFETCIRREALRKRLEQIDSDERVARAFAGGHLPKIDVDLATLANSRPAA